MTAKCRKCPKRIRNGSLCRDCSLEERYGHAVGQDSQVDREVLLECIECGETYLGTSSTACPECGESRCRAAESEVATDGGRDATSTDGMERCEVCGDEEASHRPHVAEGREAYLCDPCNRVEIETYPEIRERYENAATDGDERGDRGV